jgi:hypothetical protein
MNKILLLLTFLLVFSLNLPSFLHSNSIIYENEAQLNYPDGLIFKLQVESNAVIEKVTLIYWTEERSCQSGTAHKDMDFDPAAELELEWEWEFHRDSTIPPGVVIEWQWEIIDSDGIVTITDPKQKVIQDQRHDWQEISRDGLTIQWYRGENSFGEDVHHIGLDSLDHVSKIMGIEVEDDIRIVIYPSPDEVREAVKFTADWVGGVAFPKHKVIIITGIPGQDEWFASVIPHEMSHLLLEAHTFNCLGNWLPNWFREGVAECAESEMDEDDSDRIRFAYRNDMLPSLRSLVLSFSQDSQQADLDYLVSKAVVDYLIQEYRAEKMGELLDQLGTGQMIDPALQEVYGFDTDGLDAAWRKSLGFEAGAEIESANKQDQTATPIPTFALYTSVVQATSTATVTPIQNNDNTATPIPGPTGTSTPRVISFEYPVSSQENPNTNLVLIVPGILFLTCLVAGIYIYLRRRI